VRARGTGLSGSESERLRGSVGCVSGSVCGVCAGLSAGE
jgi:hypothetical protein